MRVLLSLLLISSAVVAKSDKNMPVQLTIESQDYYLCGEHTIKYAYVIKIAYVGLYLRDCEIDKQSVLNIDDKLIRFNYQVDVKAKVFIDAAEEFFMKNLKQSVSPKEIEEMHRFNNYYENIQASEYYDLYHQAGSKLKLYKNKKLLGDSEIQGFTFKYFNIWFGEYPAVKPLKKSFDRAI